MFNGETIPRIFFSLLNYFDNAVYNIGNTKKSQYLILTPLVFFVYYNAGANGKSTGTFVRLCK